MKLSYSIGHDCIEAILEGIESLNNDISKEPESANDIVAYNYLLDGLESRVAHLEERLEYLRELYDLMGEFNIPIPPDDMNEFLGEVYFVIHLFTVTCSYSALNWRSAKYL